MVPAAWMVELLDAVACTEKAWTLTEAAPSTEQSSNSLASQAGSASLDVTLAVIEIRIPYERELLIRGADTQHGHADGPEPGLMSAAHLREPRRFPDVGL
jgi:hypothetical protein